MDKGQGSVRRSSCPKALLEKVLHSLHVVIGGALDVLHLLLPIGAFTTGQGSQKLPACWRQFDVGLGLFDGAQMKEPLGLYLNPVADERPFTNYLP